MSFCFLPIARAMFCISERVLRFSTLLETRQTCKARTIILRINQNMTSPAPWKNWDNLVPQTLYNFNSNLSWQRGWFPKGSYQGAMRLESGTWPPQSMQNSPMVNSWVPDSGYIQCDRDHPSPWGGKDNEGVLVMQNGVPTRRGMCIRSKADCPIGQYGPHCAGQAHRNAMGEVVWPNTILTAPTYDPLQAANQW
jgi:hypothetical protein